MFTPAPMGSVSNYGEGKVRLCVNLEVDGRLVKQELIPTSAFNKVSEFLQQVEVHFSNTFYQGKSSKAPYITAKELYVEDVF
jgi:hypothetical protein